MSTVLIVFLMVFVLGPIARAYAQRLSRELPADSQEVRAELARVREEMDRLSAEVARLHEEQSFMVRLLSEGERKQLLERPRGPEGQNIA